MKKSICSEELADELTSLCATDKRDKNSVTNCFEICAELLKLLLTSRPSVSTQNFDNVGFIVVASPERDMTVSASPANKAVDGENSVNTRSRSFRVANKDAEFVCKQQHLNASTRMFQRRMNTAGKAKHHISRPRVNTWSGSASWRRTTSWRQRQRSDTTSGRVFSLSMHSKIWHWRQQCMYKS